MGSWVSRLDLSVEDKQRFSDQLERKDPVRLEVRNLTHIAALHSGRRQHDRHLLIDDYLRSPVQFRRDWKDGFIRFYKELDQDRLAVLLAPTFVGFTGAIV